MNVRFLKQKAACVIIRMNVPSRNEWKTKVSFIKERNGGMKNIISKDCAVDKSVNFSIAGRMKSKRNKSNMHVI